MPSDFGDESGEKLFDWMLRVGQEAGQAAMSHGAARVSMAFRNSVGEISRDGAALANPQQPETAPLPDGDSGDEEAFFGKEG